MLLGCLQLTRSLNSGSEGISEESLEKYGEYSEVLITSSSDLGGVVRGTA